MRSATCNEPLYQARRHSKTWSRHTTVKHSTDKRQQQYTSTYLRAWNKIAKAKCTSHSGVIWHNLWIILIARVRHIWAYLPHAKTTRIIQAGRILYDICAIKTKDKIRTRHYGYLHALFAHQHTPNINAIFCNQKTKQLKGSHHLTNIGDVCILICIARHRATYNWSK